MAKKHDALKPKTLSSLLSGNDAKLRRLHDSHLESKRRKMAIAIFYFNAKFFFPFNYSTTSKMKKSHTYWKKNGMIYIYHQKCEQEL